MTAAARLKEYEGINAKNAAPKRANQGSLQSNILALAGCPDPESQKAMIFAMLEDALAEMDLWGNRVFLATYVTPQISKGGILMPEKRIDASRYEGKAGLVLKIGATAFKYDGAWPWESPKAAVGDWVWYRASDAPEAGFNHVYCREIEDDLIKGTIKDPSKIF